MEHSYFTREQAMQRFFYIQGQTADSFYTDSLMEVDLEWLLFRELQRNGYERIVYYDKDWKLYCYDDVSFQLMMTGKRGTVQEEKKTRKETLSETEHSDQPDTKTEKSTGKNQGLKKGKWGKKKKETASEATSKSTSEITSETTSEVTSKKTDETSQNPKRTWIKKQSVSKLHGGVQDNEMVYRQIDACMTDGAIKTALVINDASDFIGELGTGRQHNLSNYMNLPPSNQNIIVFVFPDSKILSLLEMNQLSLEDDTPQNVLTLCNPNALELRNMLCHFHFFQPKINGTQIQLKFQMKDVLDIALESARYMQEEKVRVKALYHLLLRFAEKGEQLTRENVYQVFGGKRHKSGEEQLQRLIGMSNIKEKLKEYRGREVKGEEKVKYLTASRLNKDKPAPERKEMLHVMLTGNPGTGKTTVAKLLGQLFFEMGYLSKGHCIETDREGLVGGYVGSTAIKTRQKVMEALDGVLFIDEAYALKRTDDNNSVDYGQEAIDTLVKAMDEFKGRLIVVAAGYEKDMERFVNANPGLSSRLTLKFHIDDYTPEEMQQILKMYLKENGYRFSDSFDKKLNDFCENWVNLAGEEWGNAREAVNLKDSLIRNWGNDTSAKTETIDQDSWKIIEEHHLPKEMEEYLQPVSKMREKVMDELQALTGLSYVKEQISKIQRRMIVGSLTIPGHYVFVGNPGTGKTTIARYMGRIMRNYGLLKRGHLVEYTAGDIVTAVEQGTPFMDIARKALNGVLFIDEAYMLLRSGAGQRILGELLPFMENYQNEVCVVVAGYEEEMEELLAHNVGFQSRFGDNIILFEDYTGEELQKILIAKLEEKGYQMDDLYKEYSLRALTRYVDIVKKEKKTAFGNARYIERTYIKNTLDTQAKRLYQIYGESIPEEEKKQIRKEDIPEELVKYTKEKLPKPDTRTAAEKIEELIGFREIKEELRKLLRAAKYRQEDGSGYLLMPETLHWVIKGNPGTGKTMIAKLVGTVYKEAGILTKGHTLKVTRSDLVAEYVGQTAPKTRRMIEKAMDGVLFIDEAYSLTKGEKEHAGFGSEAINELVEAMTDRNGEFSVIAAGYPHDMDDFLRSNDGFARRFKVFTIEDYTPQELHQIFVMKCKSSGFGVSPDLEEVLDGFFQRFKMRESKRRVWGNAGETENLLRDMQKNWMENPVIETAEETTRRILTKEHIPQQLQRYLSGAMPTEEKKEKTALEQIDDMIGFDEIKERLRELMSLGMLSQQEGMEDLIEDLNLHWVLQGNPGTGKTTIAKMVGKVYKEIGLLERGHCVKVTRTELCGRYIGETSQKTKECIEQAMGGVLFIDEAYTLKREGSSGNDYGQEAIDTIMEAMSDKNGEFAVIAAGYPNEMKVFLDSNPGFLSRFSDNNFMLKDYTPEELSRIFLSICKKNRFVVDAELANQLPVLFTNMKADTKMGWANGREAENLEKRMRVVWSRSPVFQEDETHNRVRVYRIEHLPEKDRASLELRRTK